MVAMCTCDRQWSVRGKKGKLVKVSVADRSSAHPSMTSYVFSTGKWGELEGRRGGGHKEIDDVLRNELILTE